MIAVSNAWKAAHKQTILPETFVEISMDAFDTEVSNDISTVSGNPVASFSNAGAVVNALSYSEQGKYALLEQNMWTLNGSKQVLSDVGSYSASGYVSEKDTTGSLTVQTRTKRENEIPGFTIVWAAEYNEYATDFVVSVYNDSTLVASKTVSDNDSVTSVVSMNVSGSYNKVVVTINQWSVPNHRQRIDSLCYGFHWIFGKNDIMSYTHEQSGDLLSAEVSKNEITFSLDNSKDIWNPINPQGLGRYLSEQQKVVVRYGMDVNGTTEWIPGGQFFLTEWNASSNGLEANFVARDALGLLENVSYSRPAIEGVGRNPYSIPGWIYTSPGPSGEVEPTGEVIVTDEEYLVYDMMTTVWMKDTQTTTGWYEIGLKSEPDKKLGWTHTSYIDIDSAQLDCLGLLDIMLENSKTPSDFEIRVPSNVTDYRAVRLKIDNAPVSELIQMMSNQLCCRHRIDRNGLVQLELRKEGLALSDYEIPLDISKNYPEVSLCKPLSEVKVMYYQQAESWGDPGWITWSFNDSGTCLQLDNKIMVSNGWDIAMWTADILNRRTVVSGDFRSDPRLDLFDVVKVETKYGTLTPVAITRIKYTFSGTFWGTFEGRLIDL